MKPLLFISHSSEDKKIVEIVLRLLDKHVRIQPDQVRYSSRHDYGLQPGDHISIKIRADIQKSISMLALITDNSLNSEYVASELGGAWALNKRVILIYGPNLSRPKLGPPLSEYKHFSWNDTNEWLNLIKLLNKEISGTDFKENIDRDIEEAIKAIRETQPSRVSVIWKMINKKPLPFIILSLFLLPVVTYLGYQNYFVLSKEPISIDMECGRVTSDSVGVDSFDDCFASIKEWQKEFNRRNNPKVNINVRPMEEIANEADRYRDRYQRIRNNIDKKKNRYDIIQVDVIWTKIFGADFGDLEMPTEDQKQHFPAMIEAGTFTTLESGKSIKKLKAVPWSADIGVLYYNKRIVDDLSKGLDMGSGPPQTWDDLTRVATKAYEKIAT